MAKTLLLIRAKSDRALPEGGKLFNKVSMCAVAGTYNIKIEGDNRKGQKKRNRFPVLISTSYFFYYDDRPSLTSMQQPVDRVA